MKAIFIFSIVIILSVVGVAGYLYFDLCNKNEQISILFDETESLNRKLKEQVRSLDARQQALEKENAELKKGSLSYLEREKELNNKHKEASGLLKKQQQQITNLNKKIKTAEEKLEALKKENLKLADINKFAGNTKIQNQEEKINELKNNLAKAELKLKNQEAFLHYNLGTSYLKEKNYDMAINEYEKSLELNPDDADAHYNLGIIYDDLGKNKSRALEHYRKYLELKPDAPDIDEVKEWISGLEG